MNVADITAENVEFFFNKYKYNSEQIFHLERRMIAESYDFSKWEEMRTKNSVTTRNFFAENEKLLDVCLRPAIAAPEQLQEDVVEKYLRSILFFLFENNIDLHLCLDFPKAVLKNPEKYSDLINFEANLDLGICLTTSVTGTFEEVNEYFNTAWSIYKSLAHAPNDDVRINLSIGYSYHMMAFALFKSDDYAGFLKIYNNFERLLRFSSEELCAKMFGRDSDFQHHMEVILRHQRCFGIMMAGANAFGFKSEESRTEENQVALNNILNWLELEYQEQEVEGLINPMVYTYYWKWLFAWDRISEKEYLCRLLEKFNQVKNKELTFPEAGFPQDDEPLDPKFANIMAKMKLFSESFTSTFILYKELFLAAKEEELQLMIAGLIRRYFEGSKYAAKGFSEDSFIIDIVLTVSSAFHSPDELINFLNTIFVHRQISSAIHFSMVQSLAVMCFTHMVVKRPELFIVKGLYETKEAVLSHRKELMDFVRNGASLHDLGKLAATNVVNLHYRRITSAEFGIIKNHPETGGEIALKIPYIAEYHDLIIGHHKFWDGVDGYPRSFENEYSKYKNYIGLITICDCIDTSTDTQGRNYAKIKTFDDILQELKADAGRRYSADFVELIEQDESLKDELRYATTSVRKFTSYRTFNEFIRPSTSFEKEDEKDICIYRNIMHENLVEFYKVAYENKLENVEEHISSFAENNHNRTLIIKDGKEKIFGILTGKTDSSDSENKVFKIEELIILPEERRKGLASELMVAGTLIAKSMKVTKFIIQYNKDGPLANFFWIQGFVPGPEGIMEKTL